MKKLLLTITALSLCSLAVLATACRSGNETKTNCNTGWNVSQIYEVSDNEAEEKELAEQFVCFNVTNDDVIDEIWLNIGEISVDEVTFTLGRFSTSTPEKFLSGSETVTVAKTDAVSAENGWIKLKGGYNQTTSYIKIALNGGVKLNETVFLNSKKEVMKVAVYGGKVLYTDENGKITGQDFYKKEDLEKLEIKDGSPLLLLDEQDKFIKA